MANVKSRLKAPKSATAKKGRGNSKQSLTGLKNAPESPGSTPKGDSVDMGRASKLRSLTTDEKVQYAIQNGLVVKDKLLLKPNVKRLRNSRSQIPLKLPINKQNKRKSQVPKTTEKQKNSSKKLLSNQKISDGKAMDDRESPKKSVSKTSIQTVNNNELGISDQNHTRRAKLNTIKIDVKKGPETSEDIPKTIKSDDKLELNSKRGRPKGSNKKPNEKIASKTKQVTLSNGLVLTLTLFQCDYCKKMFSSKASLRRHIYRHLDMKPHACNNCSKKFRYKVHLLNHCKKQHSAVIEPQEEHLCHICNKTFKLEENLSLHLASHVKNENSYKCIYCDKKFSYHLLLIQHEKQHLITGRYQCTICSMSYDCRNRLTSHVKSHLKIKDYICQYCGKEFLRMNSMRRHMQICHTGHRIQCPICMKKLKGHLTEHMRTHKQARPHECKQCGQRFTQSTQLNVHSRCHTGDRPYLCRICNHAFTHSNALMLHIRRHTGEKPFPCAMCPMSFSQLPHMKAHMRNIHGKENPYKCPKCDQFFKLKNQVESHSKTCTVGDREMTLEEKIQASTQYEEVQVEAIMTLTRMRFLLALLLTMIASKEKLKFLGFNKRLIDDLLVESLEAMGESPCMDQLLTPFNRLKANIQLLLNKTIPKYQMEKFLKERKSTEELLEILTDEKRKKEK